VSRHVAFACCVQREISVLMRRTHCIARLRTALTRVGRAHSNTPIRRAHQVAIVHIRGNALSQIRYRLTLVVAPTSVLKRKIDGPLSTWAAFTSS
jgi:hypothetical protein